MKIIAILDKTVGDGDGIEQTFNVILQLRDLCRDRFQFNVFTTSKANLPLLRRLRIKGVFFRYTFLDYFFAHNAQNGWWRLCQIFLKRIAPLEKKLILHGCDLVYFPRPMEMCAALQKLNYITTVWDLCHRDTPEFPEVRNFSTFFRRETLFRNNLAPALLVVTDSEKSIDLISRRYGVDRDRLLAMPFFPSPFLDKKHAVEKDEMLRKYRLEPGYLFYPAQFWSHKNHIRILQALLILHKKHNWRPMLVLTGKDHGNAGNIENFIKNHDLGGQVKILGFVPSEHMRGLYESSMCVVMPTYFGPTNIPPIEAWLLKKPLIYSSHLTGNIADAAIAVNPDDADDLADAIWRCKDPNIRNRLIRAGERQLAEKAREKSDAEKRLSEVIERFAVRKQCWKWP